MNIDNQQSMVKASRKCIMEMGLLQTGEREMDIHQSKLHVEKYCTLFHQIMEFDRFSGLFLEYLGRTNGS